MNTKLLKRIIQEIHKEPRRFDMSNFIDTASERAPCGTTACIAGWACILGGVKKRQSSFKQSGKMLSRKADLAIAKQGKKLLRIDDAEASRLFYVHHWPEFFYDKFIAATTPRREAKVAIARIKHFIETGE